MATDLDATSIDAAVRGPLGKPFRYFDEIGSTNTEALGWAADGAPEGALVVADHQTQGRGRWGRSWFSAPGSLLQFSLILRPDMPLDRLGLLTTALGVACADVVEVVAGIPTDLKWPNDVMVRGRKLAGILVESRVTGARIDAAVAGVGINVSWDRSAAPDEIAERATSIASEAGASLPRAELLARVLASFESLYAAARDPERSATVIDRATQRSQVLGRDVTVRYSDGRTVEGMATRLLANGALELDIDGHLESIHVAEIEQLRPADGRAHRRLD
ncbi:MAG: BirA family transcriptional regulator [Actinomycetota bacterium]|jgi:BirA family biotin operon repressor/biotin-[acetyl-CoA-carboxylase] ligase|nr:BirA family transcriptional regulator [Actinomycetota bacterium]